MHTKSQWRNWRLAAAVTAAVALTAPASAVALEYHLVAGTSDLIVLIDKDSILRSGDIASGWITTIYRTPEKLNDLPMAFLTTKEEVDCAQRRLRTVAFQARGADAVLFEELDDAAAEWGAIKSGTIAEDWVAALCRPETLSELKFPVTDLKILREAFLATD